MAMTFIITVWSHVTSYFYLLNDLLAYIMGIEALHTTNSHPGRQNHKLQVGTQF